MPDVQELNLDDLNPYEGATSILLAESKNGGLWKGVTFDPTRFADETGKPYHFLTLQNNEIILDTKVPHLATVEKLQERIKRLEKVIEELVSKNKKKHKSNTRKK